MRYAGYHLGGFSCCRAWSLGQAGFSSCGKRTQQLCHMGFAPPRHMESSQTRDRTCFSCIGRWILNHWTTREGLFFHSYPNFPKIHAFYYVIILMKRFFNASAEKESFFLLPSVCTFGNSILFPKIKMFFFFFFFFSSWVGRIPWSRKWQPSPVLLPGKSIPWTEAPGGLQSMRSQMCTCTCPCARTHTHTHTQS